jgi:archaellum component FlaF (FlaF/FlaG flagellin family)
MTGVIMNKIIGIIVIISILGLTGFVYVFSQGNLNENLSNATLIKTNNDTVQNAAPQENTAKLSENAKDNDVVVTQKGPTSPQKKGTKALIEYTIINKGKNSVYEVNIGGQHFNKNFGALNPGQTIKFTYMMYIPTDDDVASEIGEILPNPLEIGGVDLSFMDNKHVYHSVQSNPIIINLF